jgi:hypothetical protein
MTAGPAGPGGPGGPTDPTMPLHPGAGAPPVYAPPPEQRFDRTEPQPYPPGYGPGGYPEQGPSMQDRAADMAASARRAVRTPETKEFFKTSEFMVWALTLLMVVIAGATAEAFDAGRVWLYVSIVSAAYIVSRGLAKAGTSRGKPESHWGHDHQA